MGRMRKIVIHVDEVLCHGENGGATWQPSHRGCIMRKFVSKEVTARGRFDFFLDSASKQPLQLFEL